MNIVAHRGGAAHKPGNTIPAVREGATNADAVEIDVRQCATGEIVVVHDAVLSRIVDADLEVGHTAYSELEAISLEAEDVTIPHWPMSSM